MENKKSETLGEKTISGTIWTFAEKLLGQGASLIVSIFLSRLLFPEEYGVIAIASIFISISTVFVTCGLSTALVQKKIIQEIDYSTAFVASLFLSCIFFVLLFLGARPIALFFGAKYDTETIVWVIRLLSLNIPVGSLTTVQSAYVQKNFLFKKVFWASLIGTVISGIAGVACAYAGFGPYALVVQALTDVIVDLFFVTVFIKWLPKLKFSMEVFKELFGFSSKILLTTLIDRCYNSLTDFFIGKKYTSADLALYNKGKQFPDIICTNIEGSIEKVLFPAMSELQDNKEAFKRGVRRSIKTSSYIIFPMLVGIICVGESLIVFLFTEKWSGCVPYLIMMCLSFLTTSLRSPILQAIKAVGRSDIYLKLDIVKKIIGISALLISLPFGPLWICFGFLCSSILGLIVNLIPSKKLFDYSILEIIKDVFPIALLNLIMGGCVYAISFLKINSTVLLFIQIAAGIIIYLILSFVTKNEVFNYILTTLKPVVKKIKIKRG